MTRVQRAAWVYGMILVWVAGCGGSDDDVDAPEQSVEDAWSPDVSPDEPDALEHDIDVSDTEDARNACGGSQELRFAGEAAGPGEACGDCGEGELVCASQESLLCAGELPANACGGCGALEALPGDACGACLRWQCTDTGELLCDADSDSEGCGDLLRCEDLACAEEGRICEASDGASDAACSSCMEGFEEVDGACEEVAPPVRSCEEAGCAEEERVCVQPDAETDATCGACLEGFEEDNGVCAPEASAPRALGEPCAADEACISGAWCPTDTSERRCSPRPVVGGVEMPFQWVPRGEFTMGSPPGEVGRLATETESSVTLTRDFFVQRTQVTQAQWTAVMEAWNALPDGHRTMQGWSEETPLFGTTPSCFRAVEGTSCAISGSNPNHPVERVSWWDALVYANALSILEGLEPCYTLTACDTGSGVAGVGGGCSGTAAECGNTFACAGVSFVGKSCTGYRLLTGAEHERAARGDTTTATYNGDLDGADCAGSMPVLDEIAWYDCNSGRRTHPVGGKLPNRWGLYDMLGNVWEWGLWSTAGAQSGDVDPSEPSTANDRMLRGGAADREARFVRAAYRGYGPLSSRNRFAGIRLARTVEP